MHRRYDVYDDTGHMREYHHHHPGRALAHHQYGHDNMFDMMEGMHREMQRHSFPMFGSMMQGMHSLFDSFDRAFEHSTPGESTYYYQSHTRTVGPDGRVVEETVRTTPGPSGRPETSRTVRDADGNEHVTKAEGEFPPMQPPFAAIEDAHRSFDNGWRAWPFSERAYPQHDTRRLPPAQVEEIHDDDTSTDAHRNHSRRAWWRDRDEPIVEEPNDNEDTTTQQPRTFRERARAWRNRY